MRKRRLYRYSRTNGPARGQGEAEYPQINPGMQRQIFNAGVNAGVRMSAQQQSRIMAEQERNMLARVKEEPWMVMARKSGYDMGFAAGTRHSSTPNAPEAPAGFSYTDVEDARRRGYAEGKSAAPAPDRSAVRGKLIDEVLEQCRIISESNPNMAPGVNAVRHLVKKL